MSLVASPQTPIEQSGFMNVTSANNDEMADSDSSSDMSAIRIKVGEMSLNDSSPRTPINKRLFDNSDENIDNDSESAISSSSSSDDDYLSDRDVNTNETIILSPTNRRKTRTRTVEAHSPMKHVASSEKVRRNTDSMLEDAFIADKLKRRLGSRRETRLRRTIAYSGLSDFIMESIMEGGTLDAISAALPTDEKLCHAANIAFHACMAGYFGHLTDELVIRKLKHLFSESLERVEFRKGEYICRQDEQVEKLFVVEEGTVQFSCRGCGGDDDDDDDGYRNRQVAGDACGGAVLGELSLVYGIPAPSDIECITPCAILWAMDALSYRRIQAVVAKESLKKSQKHQSSAMLEEANDNEPTRVSQIQILRRKCSSFLDLQEESNRFDASDVAFGQLEKVSIIGKGAFGSVYIVEDKKKSASSTTSVGSDDDDDDKRYYSLKCMSKSSIVECGNEKRVLIEKHALQASVSSPFVISLFGTFQDEDSIYFLTDFIQGGNLMGHMINRDILPHEECVFFAANIVSGLTFLHSRGFVHRDIKPENCLIGKDGYLRLCDCGMAKRLPSTVQLPSGGTEVVTLAFTMCGTPEFMAPEFVLSTGYSKGIDWWALGCILSEMYSGRSPFEFDGDLKKTFKKVCLIGIGRESFAPPTELEQMGMEDALDFARHLLSKASDRLGRHSSRKVKDHKYFSDIDFEQLRKKLVKPPYLPRLAHAVDSSHFDVRPDDHEEIEPYTGSNDIFRDF